MRYVNQASGIQSKLPTSLKHGGETRPWRSLTAMFSSISQSRDTLVPLLRARQKEHLITRIDVDLLNEVVSFLDVFPSLFDISEYANLPNLQNSLPVYYMLHEAWQPQPLDTLSVALMKKEFLAALTNKYWGSLNMLHFVATFLDPTLRRFTFVRNVADRKGFFKQVTDCLQTLAEEPNASLADDPANVSIASRTETADPPDVTAAVPSPTKKVKASHLTGFRMLPSTSPGKSLM